jgi:hypothetical protein
LGARGLGVELLFEVRRVGADRLDLVLHVLHALLEQAQDVLAATLEELGLLDEHQLLQGNLLLGPVLELDLDDVALALLVRVRLVDHGDDLRRVDVLHRRRLGVHRLVQRGEVGWRRRSCPSPWLRTGLVAL